MLWHCRMVEHGKKKRLTLHASAAPELWKDCDEARNTGYVHRARLNATHSLLLSLLGQCWLLLLLAMATPLLHPIPDASVATPHTRTARGCWVRRRHMSHVHSLSPSHSNCVALSGVQAVDEAEVGWTAAPTLPRAFSHASTLSATACTHFSLSRM